MSVYHNNNHSGNNSLAGHGVSNGTQMAYHQTDIDFSNRNFAVVNHSETSVQLTRPTSKTALLVRQRRAMLEQLSCFICKGYLVDATTIDECMDSFCKSCIVIYLKNHNNCPKCGTAINRNDPISAIRSDKVLQDIVYKMVPGLFDDEMRRRRDFYRGLYGGYSSNEDDDSTDSNIGPYPNLTGEQYGIVTHPKPFYKPADNIDLSIEPQTRGDSTTVFYDNRRQSVVTCFTGTINQRQLPGPTFSSVDSQHFKTYLRCPAKFTILQLKRFIAAKFNTCRDDTIHLLYLNETLKDEYSLVDVAYIYDWRGIEHMQLFYIIERDLSKPSRQDECNSDGQQRNTKVTRQSVASSTQTIKRVCIDPQPKFYGGGVGNSVSLPESEGRSMRSRVDLSNNSVKRSTSAQVTQTPIIRSYNSRECARSRTVPARQNQSDEDLNTNSSQNSQRSANSRIASNAIEERLRRNETTETRSLRSQQATTSNVSLSRHNISLDALSQTLNQRGRKSAQRVQSADQREQNSREAEVIAVHHQQNVTANIGPSNGADSSRETSPTMKQSSLVTLAHFNEANSNKMVSSRSDAKDPTLGTSPTFRNGASNQSSNSHPSRDSQTPQLAFSFVTERGITIVRRLNNQNDPSNLQSSTPTSTRSIDISTPQAATQASSTSATTRVVSPSSGRQQATVSSPGHYPISGNNDVVSARHHIKVKPVYKTFVDPTKLKSPNFKRLGFTARH